MLFISEAIAFLLSLSVSSSVILSFVPTYCNQLPPSDKSDGPPFSPEREMFRKLSFAPTYKTLLSTRQTAVAVCRLSDFGRSTQACFPLFTHRGINYPPTSSVHPFSPERKTCYMLFISEAIAFLLSLSFSSSVILSFVPTYRNQLSPI
jgi:hypothetical protein